MKCPAVIEVTFRKNICPAWGVLGSPHKKGIKHLCAKNLQDETTRLLSLHRTISTVARLRSTPIRSDTFKKNCQQNCLNKRLSLGISCRKLKFLFLATIWRWTDVKLKVFCLLQVVRTIACFYLQPPTTYNQCSVVYLSQQIGALQLVCWLKSYFLRFLQVFSYFLHHFKAKQDRFTTCCICFYVTASGRHNSA